MRKQNNLLLTALLIFSLCSFVFADDHSSAPATDIYNKAILLYKSKKWSAAKEYFHQYLAEYSDTPLYVTCLYYLAYCQQQLKNTQEAIIIYHKVINFAKDGDTFWGEMAQRRVQELE